MLTPIEVLPGAVPGGIQIPGIDRPLLTQLGITETPSEYVEAMSESLWSTVNGARQMLGFPPPTDGTGTALEDESAPSAVPVESFQLPPEIDGTVNATNASKLSSTLHAFKGWLTKHTHVGQTVETEPVSLSKAQPVTVTKPEPPPFASATVVAQYPQFGATVYSVPAHQISKAQLDALKIFAGELSQHELAPWQPRHWKSKEGYNRNVYVAVDEKSGKPIGVAFAAFGRPTERYRNGKLRVNYISGFNGGDALVNRAIYDNIASPGMPLVSSSFSQMPEIRSIEQQLIQARIARAMWKWTEMNGLPDQKPKYWIDDAQLAQLQREYNQVLVDATMWEWRKVLAEYQAIQDKALPEPLPGKSTATTGTKVQGKSAGPTGTQVQEAYHRYKETEWDANLSNLLELYGLRLVDGDFIQLDGSSLTPEQSAAVDDLLEFPPLGMGLDPEDE